MRGIKYLILLVPGLLFAVELQAQKEVDIPAFEQFWRPEYQVVEGIMRVYHDREKVFLEVPESLLERDFCIVAQTDRGFGWRNRYLTSLGVVKIRKGPGNILRFFKGLYQERLRGKTGGLQAAFEVSNQQPLGLIYPVVAFRQENSAYIIDISKAVRNGDEWFQCRAQELKGLHPSETTVKCITALEDGLCFTIGREYGTESRLNSGSPLEISCVIRLLPNDPLAIRYADPAYPYTSLAFTDYGKMPYGAVRDSLICRWRLTEPLVCYIDPLCPPGLVAYIRKGVMAWEKAFERAGFHRALQVKLADRSTPLADKSWVISYDLGRTGPERSWIIHPETGEIVYARLNFGHGVLLPALTDYWWECGTWDKRIRKDRVDAQVAGEILQQMVSREVGLLLGLLPCSEEKCVKESVLKGLFHDGHLSNISDADYRQLAWGYRQSPGREIAGTNELSLQKALTQQLMIVKRSIGNRSTMFRNLKKRLENSNENPLRYRDFYEQGLTYYYRDLRDLMKLLQPEVFAGVMECLDSCFWGSFPDWLDIPELRRARQSGNENVIRKACQIVLEPMLQADASYLQEIHRKTWQDFDKHLLPSGYQMEIQKNFLTILLEMNTREKIYECRDDQSVFWWNELNFLTDKFTEMSRTHQQQKGKDYYNLLLRRMKGIKKCEVSFN